MRVWILASMLLAAVAAAMADEPLDRIPSQLRNCVAIKRNTERLACFDNGIAAIQANDSTAEPSAAPSAESSFGMYAQTPAGTGASAAGEDVVEVIEAHIKTLGRAADGSYLIELDNQQSWRQLSGSANLLLKVGDAVQIRRAALGSFRLNTPSGRTAKVKRVH